MLLTVLEEPAMLSLATPAPSPPPPPTLSSSPPSSCWSLTSSHYNSSLFLNHFSSFLSIYKICRSRAFLRNTVSVSVTKHSILLAVEARADLNTSALKASAECGELWKEREIHGISRLKIFYMCLWWDLWLLLCLTQLPVLNEILYFLETSSLFKQTMNVVPTKTDESRVERVYQIMLCCCNLIFNTLVITILPYIMRFHGIVSVTVMSETQYFNGTRIIKYKELYFHFWQNYFNFIHPEDICLPSGFLAIT